jgi:uncharacterized protein
MRPSEALNYHRASGGSLVDTHWATNPRVFGSALQGDDADSSGLDIVIDGTQETTLFDIGALRFAQRELLDVPVDVVTPNAHPGKFRAAVLAQARPV